MKEYKLKSEEIIKLVELKGGCIASDKITVDGFQVGYMYRENPSNESDSGCILHLHFLKKGSNKDN